MGSENGSNNLRVDSFSCYLKTPEDNFVLKLAGMQDAAPPFMTPPETPVLRGIGRTTKENQSIIGADKYYSGRMSYDKEGVMDLSHVKPSRFTARTPSMNSEVTNWNSRSGLLQRNPSQIKQRGPFCKRFFLSFGCSGPCASKKDVFVHESGYDSKKSQSGYKRGDQFDSPVSDHDMETKRPFEVKVDEDPRKSIEVFRSNDLKKGDIAKNLERKLSILTWDAIPKAQEQLPSTTHVSTGVCDDMASEASSDLFEIENMCGGTGFSPLTRQPSDRLSSCSVMSLTTQYAPSEASIQWSVVTASAADFSSTMSEYDENVNSDKNIRKGKIGNSKEAQRLRSNGLLGCKSQKSVRVSESAYRASDKPKH